MPGVLDLFDFAEPSLVTGHRDTTNVPVQALYLMNSPFVQARAAALADRLVSGADNDEERIRNAFMLCFGRALDPVEANVANRFFEKAMKLGSDDAQRRHQVLVSYCQALLSTAEFRNLD